MRRGFTLFELTVVLGLFSILTVFIMSAVDPIGANARRIEDHTRRLASAQFIADSVARELSLALPPGDGTPFAIRRGDRGSRVEFTLPAHDGRSATAVVAIGAAQVELGDQQRVLIGRQENRMGTETYLNWLGADEDMPWRYHISCDVIGNAADPKRTVQSWERNALPDAVRVRVEIQSESPRLAGSHPAVGLALAPLRNAAVQ